MLGIGISVFGVGWMIVTAYVYTPYLKIRGRIYAFHVPDSRPDPLTARTSLPADDDPNYDPAPDSYGGLTTARKAWWVFIFVVALCVFNVVVRIVEKDNLWIAAIAAVIFVIFAVVLGYGDAIWGYSVARGQRIQFGIISIGTLGVFTALYLGGYFAGKRWPLRLQTIHGVSGTSATPEKMPIGHHSRVARRPTSRTPGAHSPIDTTTSSCGRVFTASAPSAVTMTMSSMRAPHWPGK